MKSLYTLVLSAGLAICAATTAVQAQTLIEEWGTAKFPAPPQLKPAKLDAKETVILMMDFTKQTCTPERRKRCADSVPKVVKLVNEARAKGALIIYSDLDKTLKDKGIKTVVAMGTQAQTSVLHTGSTAALKGFKVIVPVDGMSGDEVFPELYTAWHLATAARISSNVTLTKFELIGF